MLAKLQEIQKEHPIKFWIVAILIFPISLIVLFLLFVVLKRRSGVVNVDDILSATKEESTANTANTKAETLTKEAQDAEDSRQLSKELLRQEILKLTQKTSATGEKPAERINKISNWKKVDEEIDKL